LSQAFEIENRLSPETQHILADIANKGEVLGICRQTIRWMVTKSHLCCCRGASVKGAAIVKWSELLFGNKSLGSGLDDLAYFIVHW